MAGSRLQLATCVVAALALPGCIAHQREHSIVRCWFDYNTRRHPSLFLEQLDHKPLRAARVGSFVWMYDHDPGHGNAYSMARREWEELVAQRLNQATNAVNGQGIGVPVCEGPSQPTGPPDQISALSIEPRTETEVDSAQEGAQRMLELPGPGNEPPRSSASLSIDDFRVDGQDVPSGIRSPRRVGSDLPDDPPGIPYDAPPNATSSAVELSGHTTPRQNGRRAGNSGTPSQVARRPAGAWLFSRP